MENVIKREIELKAPMGKVWEALTDSQQFGQWFRVVIEGPFVEGQDAVGRITSPGFELYRWKVTVKKMVPEKLFSFTWHPYAIEPKRDYSQETPTLVEFHLEKTKIGTKLTVTESGFDKVSKDRRAVAFRMNSEGWTAQLKNIEEYVGS